MSILKKILFIISFLLVINLQATYAAGIDHFEVTIEPDEVQVGEAIDLTIEAVDKNNLTVEDYDGIVVIFSETDAEAEFPSALEENTYTFLASDQGKVKFENAVIFQQQGTQEINIYDLDDDTVMGIGEVIVTEKETIESIEINILSPENGIIIGEDYITISGTSQKNHTVKILVNNNEEIETVTNENGIFEKKIENLTDGNNVFKANVLDADENVVGESEEVIIKIDMSIPRIKDIQVTPSEVETESSYELKVFSNSGLTEVQAVINDEVIILTEDNEEAGTYIANSYSPSEASNYTIDVTLKDSLGHEIQELGAGNLLVKKVELAVADEETIEEEEILASAEPVDDTILTSEIKELEITGLKVIELKSKSIIQWDEIENAEGYEIYKKTDDGNLELIETVNEAKYEIAFSGSEVKYDYFAVKPIGNTSTGVIYEGKLSDATKVKTGPEILILFIISLFAGGMIYMFKTKKA